MLDELEDELNNAFDDVTDTNESNNDEEDTQITEDEETLDDLIEEGKGKSKQETDKTNPNINNDKQITKQQQNKQQRNNNSQDLLDENGNIIAKAGAERRFYEENVRLKKERDHFNNNIMPKIKQEYDTMAAKIEAYNQTFQSMQAGDLTSQDIQLGMELIRQWKQSPADTVKFLLTQAKSLGININEDGTSNKIDMQAINQMLDQKLQPFTQEREEQQKIMMAKSNARKVYDNFMNMYPDAANHVDEIAYLYKKNPNVPLGEIYWQVKNYYLQNGYDFNTPLAEINKQKTQNKNTFNGINVNQNVKTAKIQTPIAKANASFDSIIREAMQSVKK